MIGWIWIWIRGCWWERKSSEEESCQVWGYIEKSTPPQAYPPDRRRKQAKPSKNKLRPQKSLSSHLFLLVRPLIPCFGSCMRSFSSCVLDVWLWDVACGSRFLRSDGEGRLCGRLWRLYGLIGGLFRYLGMFGLGDEVCSWLVALQFLIRGLWSFSCGFPPFTAPSTYVVDGGMWKNASLG